MVPGLVVNLGDDAKKLERRCSKILTRILRAESGYPSLHKVLTHSFTEKSEIFNQYLGVYSLKK